MPSKTASPAPETLSAPPAFIPHNPDWSPEQREQAMQLGQQNAELKASLIAEALRNEKAIVADYSRLKLAPAEALQKLNSLMESFDYSVQRQGEPDEVFDRLCGAVVNMGKWGHIGPSNFVEAVQIAELKEIRPKVEATLRRLLVTAAEECLASFVEKNREVLTRWQALE